MSYTVYLVFFIYMFWLQVSTVRGYLRRVRQFRGTPPGMSLTMGDEGKIMIMAPGMYPVRVLMVCCSCYIVATIWGAAPL